MEVIGYGEDALTLWALKNRLSELLNKLNDYSDLSKCKVLFRPSFGRSGGELSSQFGEFDFIILTENGIYLGESKWDRSSELRDKVVELRNEQILRHKLFEFYVNEWINGSFLEWQQFVDSASPKLKALNINKPFVPAGSLLAKNLETILEIISNHFTSNFEINNMLLYLYNRELSSNIPESVNADFKLVILDYSEDAQGNFIRIRI